MNEPTSRIVTLTVTERDIQAVILAVSYLRSASRDYTAQDLAELLVKLGGPAMNDPRAVEANSLRIEGPC